ncbi:MAG: nucleotide-binding domain containing protein, partial [Longicatena sp.]
KQGRDVLLYVLGIGEVEQVRYYQELAKKKGLTVQAFGNQLADLLADYMLEISKRVNQTKLIFAGGDTSFHCCQKFQIQDLLIQKEIEAGIPLCRGMSSRTYDIVLKSGSFGSEDFFMQAIRKLKETKV